MATPPRRPQQPLPPEQIIATELVQISRALREIVDTLRAVNTSLQSIAKRPF